MKRITMMAVAAAMMTAPVQAAERMDVDMVEAVKPVPDVDRARELRTQAEALFSQPRQWKKAIRLLEESAQLREADDREATVCLALAGRLRNALGDHAGARQTLEKAGDRALARGSVLEAAHAYLDAASVALKEQNGMAAQSLVKRAILLVESPLLTDEQRETVTRRVAE